VSKPKLFIKLETAQFRRQHSPDAATRNLLANVNSGWYYPNYAVAVCLLRRPYGRVL